MAIFVRVTPYPSYQDHRYMLFYYCIAWTKDYGRYVESPEGEAHNGDTECVILAYKIIDNYDLQLAWVFTSAHGGVNDHSGVWSADRPTTNQGWIAIAVPVGGDITKTKGVKWRTKT